MFSNIPWTFCTTEQKREAYAHTRRNTISTYKYGSRATVYVLLWPELTHVAVSECNRAFQMLFTQTWWVEGMHIKFILFGCWPREEAWEVKKRERWKRKTSKNLLPSTLDLYVRSSTLLTDLVFLFLWNSRGGLLCGTIKPLRIRQDIKDKQRVVGKSDKRQQDMAAIMVSNISVIISYLITFYLRPRLSNIVFPHFFKVWNPEYWNWSCRAIN